MAAAESSDAVPPTYVATSMEHHSHLHRCKDCGAWWQFNEREAHVIDDREAKETFPAYFATTRP
jgi:hypothetical protein